MISEKKIIFFAHKQAYNYDRAFLREKSFTPFVSEKIDKTVLTDDSIYSITKFGGFIKKTVGISENLSVIFYENNVFGAKRSFDRK